MEFLERVCRTLVSQHVINTISKLDRGELVSAKLIYR